MSISLDIRKNFKGFSLDMKFDHLDGTLGILGASGCGKSLTLKCLAGLEAPDEGIIRVGDRTVFDSKKKINIKPQQRSVGYLFQNYALFPNMTVRQNIEIAMKKDIPEKDKKIETLVKRYELQGLEERYPVNLSGGQQQRVALARIFAYEPDILLLDEPFSALDSYLRETMQATLLDIIKEYKGDVIMVTHSRDEAYKICDRLLVLDAGRIVGDDKPSELFKNPGTVEVARITGCKNISPIEKINENRIYAKAWGIELDVNGPVGDKKHVGIRAHYFNKEEATGRNKFKFEISNVITGPFDKNVILKNPEFENSERLWWICDKNVDISGLGYLYIDKDNMFLLE